MKKLLIDIGTNEFQGYGDLVGRLGIDDSWYKIFIEPNPRFASSTDYTDRVKSIPNAKFISAGIDITTGKKRFTVEKNRVIDQGGSFHNQHLETSDAYEVLEEIPTITFGDVVKDYLDGYEWYIKFDCEGCEYDCLIPTIEVYHPYIKWLACEFHHLGNPNQNWRIIQRQKILDTIGKYQIPFVEWY